MIIRRKNDKWDEPGAGSHYKTIAARAHVCVCESHHIRVRNNNYTTSYG